MEPSPAIDHKNQKHMVPRFSAAGQRSMSRSLFLDGTLKTFYGPGQQPNLATQSYAPPTDWPSAGTLLRVPQVVHLNAWVRGSEDRISDRVVQYRPVRFVEDGEEVVVIGIVGGQPITYVYPWPNETVTFNLTNPGLIVHDQAVAAFNEAAQIIGDLRPNRTWVEVIDWSENAKWVTTDWNSDTFFWIPTSPSSIPFFGTDFLSCWYGHPAAFNRSYSKTLQSWTNQGESSVWSHAKSRLDYGLPYFRRYRNILAIPSVAWDTVVLEGVFPTLDSDNISWIPLTATHASELAAGALATFQSTADVTPYSELASSSSVFLSASEIVALIADHFGFDPATGKDI